MPDNGIIYPFKFNPEQAIDSQTYNWLMCIWFAMLSLSAAVLFFADKCRLFFHAVFISVAAEFVEYLYRYNKSWASIFSYPVTVATIRFVVLFGILLYYLYLVIKKWRT